MEDACVFRRRGGKPRHAFATLILFWAQKGSDDVCSLQVSWDYICGYVRREGGEKDMVVLMFVECGCRATRNSQPHMLRPLLSLLPLLHVVAAGFLSVNMTQ